MILGGKKNNIRREKLFYLLVNINPNVIKKN